MHFPSLLFWAIAWWTLCVNCIQNNRLSKYETLSHIYEITRVKRSTKLVKELQFTLTAYRRRFHLSLTYGSTDVLTDKFEARMVHADGSSTKFPVDQGKIFTGHVVPSEGSKVSAYLEGTLWNIQIVERGEIYAVEPAWRLLSQAENPHNHSMVAYRSSDLRDWSNETSFSRFCNALPNLIKSREKENDEAIQKLKERRSRSAHKKAGKDTCIVNVVVDSDAFTKRFRRDHLITASMVITVFQVVDAIFRVSKFEGRRVGAYQTGIGLQVEMLTIYTYNTPPEEHGFHRHFNEIYSWDADQKLHAFGYYMRFVNKTYCLHHLLTDYQDSGGVLGRAYTQTLCFPPWGEEAKNAALSNGRNKLGFLLPSIMYTSVVAHEIGHNFGATHDPPTPECAPRNDQGGKYLMWTYTLPGTAPNNKQFSNCSLRQIGRNVPAYCFAHRTALRGFCGNGEVDAGEECDAGALGLRNLDTCCTESCQFKGHARCSEKNEECCDKCQIAPAGKVCRVIGYLHSCLQKSVCTGQSSVCPAGETLPDGEICSHMHVCLNGRCAGQCSNASYHSREGKKFLSCSCTEKTEACKYCCFDVSDKANPGKCESIAPTSKPDGSPCAQGICTNGECIKDYSVSGKRLEQYIPYVHRSSLTELVRSNIVLAVVTMSFVVFVPSVLVISYFDRREENARELRLEQWKQSYLVETPVSSNQGSKLQISNDVVCISECGVDGLASSTCCLEREDLNVESSVDRGQASTDAQRTDLSATRREKLEKYAERNIPHPKQNVLQNKVQSSNAKMIINETSSVSLSLYEKRFSIKRK